MSNKAGTNHGIIASVPWRLVAATAAGLVAYLVCTALLMGVLIALVSAGSSALAVVGVLYMIIPILVACVASALTFHILSPRSSSADSSYRNAMLRCDRQTCLAAAIAIVVGFTAYCAVYALLTVLAFVLPRIWIGASIEGAVFVIIPAITALAGITISFCLVSRRPPTGRAPFHDTVPRYEPAPYHYTVPRYERTTCLAVAIPLFVVVLLMTPFVLEKAARFFGRSDFISGSGASELLSMILFLGLSLGIPYGAGRTIYYLLRWRRVYSADPLCPKCLYNLTSNVSGICPECGTKIDPAETKAS